ncbi:MAG TPA: O-antigen ligase family protein [Patescibacteria group bacterium]|jgi:O-antigen ligase|nr:O-antigen ligase family protein [Patescibacteria group bacterium]
MKLFNFCNKVIEYSFYLLFFLIPLAFTSDTSELFEFNKLWLTFIITIVIGLAWITKMVIRKEIKIQRTLLDIPILLFLASQIISSFLSLDMHVSLWGYYSRFNGGLFSIFAYVFLYYAFVSNLRDEQKEEKAKFEFKKIYLYIAGIIVFVIGLLVSSQIKNPDMAGIPYQGLATLTTALASFTVLMLAAPKGILKRSFYAILSSALLVILWGLPSHFGYDPTCLLFRGTFDVSCWTEAFQPRVRIFSTLGQPDWLAAYLAALLPLIAALLINSVSDVKLTFDKTFAFLKTHPFWLGTALFAFFVATYAALMYAGSRSAILAIWVILPVFLLAYGWFYLKPKFDKKNLTVDFKLAVVVLLTIGIVPFFAGQPFGQLNIFTLSGLQQHFAKPTAVTKTNSKVTPTSPPSPVAIGELGGTDSGKIRLLVWKGAVDIWLHNPIFGSGLETYAFAYYQYRPAAHNLTSEAKYLYNKAHNEYLNYLATTGTVGIITYLFMIGAFLFVSCKSLFARRKKLTGTDFIALSLLAGYGTVLITNFFGFSVVMVNILFYLFPAFVFLLLGKINFEKTLSFSLVKKESYDLNKAQKALIIIFILLSGYLIYTLISYWNADRYYYYGLGYDNPSMAAYDKAYPFLKMAVATRPSEPTFLDEFAYNNAVLGASILAQVTQQPNQQNQSQNTAIAKQLIDTAIADTNQVTTEHPNDIIFWKTKVRIFYTLSQVNPQYLPLALAAIKQAAKLAPTDADVSYNLGVLQGQNGDSKNAVATLQNTIKLKADYAQAYYALGIFYRQLAVDKNGKVVDQTYNQKAIDEMNLMLKYFGPNQQASDAIKAWQK